MTSVLDKLSRFSTREQVRNWLGIGWIRFERIGNFGSLAPGGRGTPSFSIPGAKLGDFVDVGMEVDLQGVTLTAYVESEDSVKVVAQNDSGSTADLGETTLHIQVRKR